MESNSPSPQEQLDLLAASQRSLHERAATPGWYYPALGSLMAGYVVALGLVRTNWQQLVVVALLLVGLGVIVRSYRRRTGIWASSLSMPGRHFMAALVVLYLGGVLTAYAVRGDLVATWVLAPAAAIVLGGTLALGPRWEAYAARHQAQA